MSTSIDIRHWSDIDPQYISDVFTKNGIDANVLNLRTAPVGTGKIGECIRFELSLDPDSDSTAPKSLIGKFPSDEPHSRAFGADYGMYEREIKFYQLLQPNLEVSTPHCYFADIDLNTQDFVLIMSDAAPAVAGNQLKGISLEQARVVTKAAAKLHAPYWRDDSLNDHEWINNTVNAPPDYDPNIMPPLWAGFLDRYGEAISEKAKAIGQALFDNFDKFQAYRTERYGLTHLDFRPDNMLFAGPDGGEPISIVDWQSITYGPVATDLSYCFAGALEPQLRREHEADLVELYLREMENNGAGPYESGTFRRHFITGGYKLFLTAFSSSMMTDREEQSDKMFFKMLNGAVDFIYDQDAEKFDF